MCRRFRRRRRRKRGGVIRHRSKRLKRGGNLFRSEPFIGQWSDEPLDAALDRQRRLNRMLQRAARG